MHLDATPARLLAQLSQASGEVTITAMAPDGVARHEAMPAEVRRARYQLGGRSIESTPAAAFVALSTGGGRLVVSVLHGEVVVVTSTDNRTALAAHETLVSEASDAEPRVVATAELSGDDRSAVDSAIEEVTAALSLPMEPAEPETAETEPAGAIAAADVAEEVEEALAEEEHVERRGVAAGIAIGVVLALIVLVTGLIVLPGDDEAAVAPPPTTEAPATSAAPTTEDTAATTQPPTTRARPTTTAAPTTTTARPVSDYTLTTESCRQSGDTVTLTARIANNADGPWSFSVTASFADAGGDELDRATTDVGPVAPAGAETFTIEGTANRAAARCDIVDVESSPAA